MFYYISFLRAPPLQTTPTDAVKITPQISNDLRTELFAGAQDIYYSWVLASPTPTSTSPIKLTTWRPSSAYKVIPVPLPPIARAGQSWRLVLSPGPGIQFRSVDLQLAGDGLGEGALPMAVMSTPIGVVAARGMKGTAAAAKLDCIERAYRMNVHVRLPRVAEGGEEVGVRPRTRLGVVGLRVTEQTSFDLDKKIWDSGIGLGAWLSTLCCEGGDGDGALAAVREVLFTSEPRKVVELGAGVGIVSLALASLRHGVRDEDGAEDCILATDVDSAMPLLEHNIRMNQHLYPTNLPRAAILDWDDDALPDHIAATEGGFHAIIMADVAYNTSSFPSLVRTMMRIVKLSSNASPPMILLGYKERDVAERSLWDMTQAAGIKFEKIAERIGAGGAPVEIWLGTVTSLGVAT